LKAKTSSLKFEKLEIVTAIETIITLNAYETKCHSGANWAYMKCL
jgi:hypothetical protein